eukprot:4566610-Lingulodinium_polyedra.AAC.1
MFRRLQTIEFSHAERAREAEGKSIPASSRLTLEEQMAFTGCPALAPPSWWPPPCSTTSAQ